MAAPMISTEIGYFWEDPIQIPNNKYESLLIKSGGYNGKCRKISHYSYTKKEIKSHEFLVNNFNKQDIVSWDNIDNKTPSDSYVEKLIHKSHYQKYDHKLSDEEIIKDFHEDDIEFV